MSNIIRTFTDKYKDLGNFESTINNVCVLDIAHAGSQLCRFGGHSKRFCSVTDHSRLVSYIVKEDKFKPLALAHDCGESYFIEMPRPLKIMFPEYRDKEQGANSLILKKFKIHQSSLAWKKVKEADEMAFLIERTLYFGDEDLTNAREFLRSIKWVASNGTSMSKRLFIERWKELGIKYE
jgi:hypothetical protein